MDTIVKNYNDKNKNKEGNILIEDQKHLEVDYLINYNDFEFSSSNDESESDLDDL